MYQTPVDMTIDSAMHVKIRTVDDVGCHMLRVWWLKEAVVNIRIGSFSATSSY